MIYSILYVVLQDVVRKIEEGKTDRSDKPEKDIVIADSGVLPVPEPFGVGKDNSV